MEIGLGRPLPLPPSARVLVQPGLLGRVYDVDDVNDLGILVDREEHPVGYHQLRAELTAMEAPLVAGGARGDLQLVDRGVDPA